MATKTATTKLHRVRIEGLLLPYSDAKEDVTIERSLIDIWKGQPGDDGKCMNAECIMRNKGKFPHPVLAASVIKSRVYILVSPTHAVRYLLSKKDSDLIQRHDEDALSQPGTLTLRAPRGNKKAGNDHRPRSGASKSITTGKWTKPLAKGAKARVMAAAGALK